MKYNDIRDSIWNNNRYYILSKTNTFEIYDDNNNLVRAINTEIDYNLISYNAEDKCFYLKPVTESDLLHKTNDLKTFDVINLNLPINHSEEIRHISYCKCLKGLLITTDKHLFIFNLANNRWKILFEKKEEPMQASDCMGPLGHNKHSFLLSAGVCCHKELFIAYRLNKVSYIAKLKDGELDEIVYKTNNFIKTMFIVKNELWILISNKCYQELINTGIECNCEKLKNCDCGIIESIASIEKSIAKILDSESLKIKAAIDKADGINDLLCVNSSVKEIIYYITMLEFILSEKLKVVKQSKKEE